MGFTIDSQTREEYLKRLSEIQNLSPLSHKMVERAKFHALTIFRDRPWKMKSFKAEFMRNPKGRQSLDHNLELNASSMDEIRENGDLDRWAQWAENSDAVDYLEYDEN